MSRRNWYLLTNSAVLLWIVLTLVVVIIHRFIPQPLWTMLHVPLLGAATAAILIWSQHFADTLLRRDAPVGRAGLATRLILHTLGTATVVTGMMSANSLLVVVGAIVVGVAIITHAVILFVQLRVALPSRFGPLVRFYISASLVFLLGIALGAIMQAFGDPTLTDRLVIAHLLLNAYGWIGLTALGTLVLLWPTVLHARMSPTADATAKRALWILTAGIVVAAAGAVVDLRLFVPLGVVIWLVGIAMMAREGWRAARSMPPGTFAGWSLLGAFCWLVIAGATLGVQAVLIPDWTMLREAYLLVLGPLVAGFVVQLITGALSYLLPVVALGSPAAAKAGAQVLDRGAAFRAVAFNGSILLYLLPMPSLVRVLLSFLAAGVVVAFVVLAVRAIVVGRRVRREEGDKPNRARAVSLAAPTTEAPEAPRRAGSVVAAFAVIALCVAAGIAADPAASGISIVGPSSDVVATGETTQVTVQVEGMRFVPDVIEVPVGNTLEVTFENTGTDVHDLTFANGVRSTRLAPGESEIIDVGVIGADMQGWCSIAGHRQMGMELTVRAIGAPADAAGDDGSHHGGASTNGSTSGDSAAADIDLQREPDAGFTPWPAALDPARSEQVHKVTLNAREIVQEVAPGVKQARWTFGPDAPGPTLRGKVGDRFEITLVNDGTIGHSIDFHAGALAPDEPMRTIQPGETLTYNFTATRAGIWMYHCSTMPMSMHIANGMYGAVIIDPPDLAPVDREYMLVQGELYLGPQGEPADAAAIAQGVPDLVAFNGYADQYLHRPLEASVGERVRIWVLDAGPNSPSSFHVIGGQFDTVYLESSYRLRPTDSGGSQALGLQPAQGGFVELSFPEPGNYPFVTHRMSDAERGARGLFHVE